MKLSKSCFALKSKYNDALVEIDKLRKEVDLLKLENASKENEQKLFRENVSLKEKIDKLTKDLIKFVKGKENLILFWDHKNAHLIRLKLVLINLKAKNTIIIFL